MSTTSRWHVVGEVNCYGYYPRALGIALAADKSRVRFDAPGSVCPGLLGTAQVLDHRVPIREFPRVPVAIFGNVLTGKHDLEVVVYDDSRMLLAAEHVHYRIVGQIDSGLRRCWPRCEPERGRDKRGHEQRSG
jgi:hypothetical protein